jgi:precorrin-3B synthase
MEAGDGWLLRVRLPGGAIAPDQLDVVADTSQRWGRGIVEITARGNLQLRGVVAGAVDAAAGALVDGGLALPDPALDARRGVVAPPLTGHDPTEVVAADALVDDLVAAVVGGALPVALAPKFGVVIDTAGAIAVSGVPADVLLAAGNDGRRVGWTASIGHGAAPRWSGRCEGGDLVAMVVEVATRCATRGCRAAELPDADIAAFAGGRPRAVPPPRRTTSPAAGVGVWDHVDPARASVVGAPSLRRLGPAELRGLAGAARRGLGIRFSPSGSVAIVGVRRDELDAVTAAVHAAGCTTDPLDGRLAVSACVGSDGCAAARADTLGTASALMAGRGSGRVHLSGCEKRCGAPADALVLVADDAGRFEAAP